MSRWFGATAALIAVSMLYAQEMGGCWTGQASTGQVGVRGREGSQNATRRTGPPGLARALTTIVPAPRFAFRSCRGSSCVLTPLQIPQDTSKSMFNGFKMMSSLQRRAASTRAKGGSSSGTGTPTLAARRFRHIGVYSKCDASRRAPFRRVAGSCRSACGSCPPHQSHAPDSSPSIRTNYNNSRNNITPFPLHVCTICLLSIRWFVVQSPFFVILGPRLTLFLLLISPTIP